jgi:probable F420-dependent oxidoreductase
MVPHWGESASPEAIGRVARLAEELAFDSLWLGDHLAVPVADATAARDRFFEILMVLGHLTGITRRILLGTGVLILPYRHPLLTASALATADRLSGGRIVFGVASGWLREEFEALGVPFTQRGARTDESLAAIRCLWTKPRPHAFNGRFARFEDVKFAPELYPDPAPPVWIGGNSRAAMHRAVRFGDAWFPLHLDLERLRRRVALLREASDLAGRARPPLVALASQVDLGLGPAGPPRGFHGSPRQVADQVAAFAAAGVEHLVLDFPRASLALLCETMEAFAGRVVPEVR